LATGDPDAGIETMRRAAELSPAFSIGRGSLASWEAARGNHAEALNEARIAEQLFRGNTNPTHVGELVNSYGRVGHRDDAERLFHQLEELAETRRIPAAAWILAYLGLGDDEQALSWLTTAADTPEPYEGYFALMLIKSSSHFDPVLDEPRFQAVRDKLGYKD
jgi:Flp pilus assembly protein TadD